MTASLSLMATAAVADAEQDPIATAPPVVAAVQQSSRFEGPPVVPQAPMSTDAQIDAFIRSAPSTPWSNYAPLTGQDIEVKRQIHGQAGVAVGTGGYRSAFVQTDIPIGETGMLSVAVSESRGEHAYRGYYDYGYDRPGAYGAFGSGGLGNFGHGARQSVGVSLYLGDSARSGDCRRRFNTTQLWPTGSGWTDDGRCVDPRGPQYGRYGARTAR
ncbi:hypothetical protein [Phenylobacterium aquaticum]|uniref:hypothetical protein n=1 Tax=Phenylobacterium aquaticum TaxID=1763816 RepID=UPI001F5D3C3B|nr:hypothetical protein [Phenylobacterium aquaticum]MCI3130779.1 hypothetical protein [Phenylobacterium aquaticum]